MKDKTSLKLPIYLMVGPAALLVGAFLLYAITNAVAASMTTPSADPELFAQTPVLVTVINIFLFLAGAVSVITFLPCLIIGLVVLVQRLDRRKSAAHPEPSQPPRQWGDLQ